MPIVRNLVELTIDDDGVLRRKDNNAIVKAIPIVKPQILQSFKGSEINLRNNICYAATEFHPISDAYVLGRRKDDYSKRDSEHVAFQLYKFAK